MVTKLIEEWHAWMLKEPMLLQGGIVMGCPLWGEDYTDYFINYGLPSIVAPRNRMALENADWQMVMFVDEQAEARLADIVDSQHVMLVRLPEDILAGIRIDPMYEYPLLAAVHNLLIHKARDIGAGFNMMVADCVYSEGYYANLLRLAKEHEAIADTSLVLSADAAPLLRAYRQKDGSLSIPGWALGYLSVERMARAWKTWSMDGITDFEQMPCSHYVHVRSRDTVRVHCAHKNAAWMSNARCQKVEPGLGGTIDSELPRYLAGSFYTPKITDDMVGVGFANDEGDGQVPLQAFADYKAEFWRFIGGKDERPRENHFLPYFTNPCEFPAPHDEQYPDGAELDARFGRLMEKLYEGTA